MKEISAEHYRNLYYEARNLTAYGHRFDTLGQPPEDAVYAIVPGYAFWYVIKGSGSACELGGVFRCAFSTISKPTAILAGLRSIGVACVSLDAFEVVANKVWLPLGFVEWHRVEFDWALAPLHMHRRQHPNPGPIIYMTKVL